MVSFTIDMHGWTPNKGKPITGQTKPSQSAPAQSEA